MKKRIVLSIVFILCVSLFTGCSATVPEADDTTIPSTPLASSVTEPPSVSETEPLPAEDTVEYLADLDIRLTFPAKWSGRYVLVMDEDLPAVHIVIDGTQTFSLASVPHDENISEMDTALLAHGYRYFVESSDRVYYQKIDADTPEDLSWLQNGAVGALSYTENDIWMLFSYTEDGENGTSTTDGFNRSFLTPNELKYDNYRLGFSFTLPEEWKGQYTISRFSDRVFISLTDQSGTSVPIFSLWAMETALTEAQQQDLHFLAQRGDIRYYCSIDEARLSNVAPEQQPLLDDLESMIVEVFSLLDTVPEATGAAVNLTFTESDERSDIVAAATNFLHDYTENTYLYTSHDLTICTVASLDQNERNSISLESSVFPAYVRTRDYLNEPVLLDQTDFLLQKAEYFKNVRMLQNIMRRDFEVAYHINLVKAAGDYAQVSITESKAFYYVDQEMQTFMDDTYEIFLYRSGGVWYVFDMVTDDGFDTDYRNTNFNAAEEIDAFAGN